jgi:hypothetical protein
MLRIEAAKLFWASPNTYYYIEFEWLLKGGYPGDTLYDLHFLAHVQNVEVDYALGSDSKISSPQNPVTSIQQNLIRGFWKTLKNRFPNVRRVVINKTWMSVVLGDIEAMPPCLRFLLESCPSDIDISAFVLEEKNSLIKNRTEAPFAYEYQRSLYRPTSDVERPFCWNRETILMPMKSSRGPVGEFERLFYENDRVLLQKNALGPLAVEALDRYHFDEGRLEPFPCPSPRCVIHFEKAGQWTIHAVETHSSAEFYYWMGLNIIPESLQGIFDRHMNDTERKGKELFKRFRSLYDAWNEEGGEKRREMENGWIDQLENDEAWNTGQDAKENERFQYFTMLMEQEVDGVNKGDPNLNR